MPAPRPEGLTSCALMPAAACSSWMRAAIAAALMLLSNICCVSCSRGSDILRNAVSVHAKLGALTTCGRGFFQLRPCSAPSMPFMLAARLPGVITGRQSGINTAHSPAHSFCSPTHMGLMIPCQSQKPAKHSHLNRAHLQQQADIEWMATNWRAHPRGRDEDQGAALQGERLALCELPAEAAPHCSNGPDAPALAVQCDFYIWRFLMIPSIFRFLESPQRTWSYSRLLDVEVLGIQQINHPRHRAASSTAD